MYHHWAKNIVAGDWLGASKPVFYLGPAYPYFLAVIYSIFGTSALAACLVQVLLSSVSVGLIYYIGRRLFGPVTGLLAGLLAATYAMLIFFSGLILGATLIVFLNLMLLALLVSGLHAPKWWKWRSNFSGCNMLPYRQIMESLSLTIFPLEAKTGDTYSILLRITKYP